MKEDLLKIINHYGVNAQQRQFNEETFELQEAITAYENDYEGLYTYGTEHIAEEIADVLVLLFQFNEYYGLDIDDISKMMDNKTKRQLERIKNEVK